MRPDYEERVRIMSCKLLTLYELCKEECPERKKILSYLMPVFIAAKDYLENSDQKGEIEDISNIKNLGLIRKKLFETLVDINSIFKKDPMLKAYFRDNISKKQKEEYKKLWR